MESHHYEEGGHRGIPPIFQNHIQALNSLECFGDTWNWLIIKLSKKVKCHSTVSTRVMVPIWPAVWGTRACCNILNYSKLWSLFPWALLKASLILSHKKKQCVAFVYSGMNLNGVACLIRAGFRSTFLDIDTDDTDTLTSIPVHEWYFFSIPILWNQF